MTTRRAPKGALIGKVAVMATLACFASSPAFGSEAPKKKKNEKEVKQKVVSGASCKAPAIAPCGACSVTCAPGEAARCITGQPAGNLCHIQPSCRCGP
jgi:hypothetical protein